MIDVKERVSRETDDFTLDGHLDIGSPPKNEISSELVRDRQGLLQAAVLLRVGDALETMVEKINNITAADYTPPQCATRCEEVGTTKAKLNTLTTILLGIGAGLFIALGAMLCTVVTTNTGLGFGLSKLVGGLVFCLGLILVVIAGAELFTGNTLMVVSWISGKTSLGKLGRNWGLVYAANLVGAAIAVGLMFATKQWTFSGHGVGANALLIANAKVNLSFGTALARGIMCNLLVCLAIWLCFSARTVPGKILAIIFPITAFVAAGFEHSIANMYFIPMGILMAHQGPVLEAAGVTSSSVAHLDVAGFMHNMIPVTIGNIIGGAIMVGVAYWLSYLRQGRPLAAVLTRPWARAQADVPAATAGPVKPGKDPVMIGVGSKGLFDVLSRAREDTGFMARLAEDPEAALKGYDLTPMEKAALASGDVRAIESQIGALDKALQTWLTARLSQEKW
jgi:formate/nitrite transporter